MEFAFTNRYIFHSISTDWIKVYLWLELLVRMLTLLKFEYLLHSKMQKKFVLILNPEICLINYICTILEAKPVNLGKYEKDLYFCV